VANVTTDDIKNHSNKVNLVAMEMLDKANGSFRSKMVVGYSVMASGNLITSVLWRCTSEICTRLDKLIEQGEKRDG